MAANRDLKLVAKIADVGPTGMRAVIDAGIRIDHLTDLDARMIFDHMLKFYHNVKTGGDIPTREQIEADFPTVDLPVLDRMKMSSTIEDFQKHSATSRLMKLSSYIEDWKDRPDEAIAHIEREVKEIGKQRRGSTDIVVSESIESVRYLYEENRNRGVLKGIPYPWKVLNDETRGMQDGEYIIFYGRPKSLKTWVALNIGMYAYDYGSRKILIYTREMAPEQMMERCVCLLIGAPYKEWKHGNLHTLPHPHGGSMEDHFYSVMETMKQDEVTCSLETGRQKGIVITSDRQDKKYGGGVRGLRNKIDDFKPDLIIADAVYLMRNDRDNGARSMKWNDQASISQDLKELAQDTKRPIVATLQANRASEKEDQQGKSAVNMSFSDSYAQDTDLAIEIIKKRVDASHNELALAITASREANIAGFAIHGDPATNFSQLYRPVSDDVGVKLGQDGKPMMMPVIFNDARDIKEIFWKDHFPLNTPDHDSPTPGRGKGPAISIPRRGVASGSV
ncbi:DnaB Replicative DNA helicase [uncultured Caudovirales phage]|uniref:DnaB Replicative DNA helicase n=1 Tax=uncultured Caudovirales phage TaxID=2100421 RepID=A0A6J5LBJ7_9CAUD|nr:DnaB Replicative DNA helicase [uncultured Caudovirales phage]CAB4135136.1 DnaB Replicative DNA helicase [uncultured Caudovirales phage]